MTACRATVSLLRALGFWLAMAEESLSYLLYLVVSLGVFHTLMGPDHYVPFVAMGRAGGWSFRRTLAITAACGAGHVLGSLVIGLVGMAVGVAVGGLAWFEEARGNLAGWLLLSFGLIYFAWGIKQAIRNKPHSHLHVHADGTTHHHTHTHHSEHVHAHEQAGQKRQMTPWILFTIFVFGPCEPLIPILMLAGASLGWGAAMLVCAVFAVCTISTMVVTVAAGYYGLSHGRVGQLHRYAHALAGFSITACGLAMRYGL